MDPEEQFRAVFDATFPVVARFARHRGLTGADVDDLVAATYETAWRRWDCVPEGDGALPWLLAVALNLLRNHRRKLTRERLLLGRLPAPEPAPPPADPPPIGWQEIRRALGELSIQDRDLVLLVAWDGLSPSQAGAVLGLGPGAARSRLHRARARLSTALETECASATGRLR